MLGTNLVAATRMHGNMVAAFVLLVIGVVLLRLLHRNANANQGLNGAPIIAFACGPVLASSYFVADVFWIGHGTYTIPSDYFDAYWRVLVIGLVAGTLGSIAFWLEPKLKRHHGK